MFTAKRMRALAANKKKQQQQQQQQQQQPPATVTPRQAIAAQQAAKRKRQRIQQANASIDQYTKRRRAAESKCSWLAYRPPKPPTFFSASRAKRDLFQRCVQHHITMCNGGGSRPPPLQIVVHGPIGCGKSFFATALMKALQKTPNARMAPVIDHESFVNSVDTGGIHPRSFLVLDDAQFMDQGQKTGACKLLTRMARPKRKRKSKAKKGRRKSTVGSSMAMHGVTFVAFVDGMHSLPQSLTWMKGSVIEVRLPEPSQKELINYTMHLMRTRELAFEPRHMLPAVSKSGGDFRQLRLHLQYPELSQKGDDDAMFDDTKALMKGTYDVRGRNQLSRTGMLGLAHSLLVHKHNGSGDRLLGDPEGVKALEMLSAANVLHDDRLVQFGHLPSYHNLLCTRREVWTRKGAANMWDERKAIKNKETKWKEKTKAMLQLTPLVTSLWMMQGNVDASHWGHEGSQPDQWAATGDRIMTLMNGMTNEDKSKALQEAGMTVETFRQLKAQFKYCTYCPAIHKPQRRRPHSKVKKTTT